MIIRFIYLICLQYNLLTILCVLCMNITANRKTNEIIYTSSFFVDNRTTKFRTEYYNVPFSIRCSPYVTLNKYENVQYLLFINY